MLKFERRITIENIFCYSSLKIRDFLIFFLNKPQVAHKNIFGIPVANGNIVLVRRNNLLFLLF